MSCDTPHCVSAAEMTCWSCGAVGCSQCVEKDCYHHKSCNEMTFEGMRVRARIHINRARQILDADTQSPLERFRLRIMKASDYYFSTPMVNSECPFGLTNPCVVVTPKAPWEASRTLDESRALSEWMRRRGFGELQPNFYQADSPELRTCEDVRRLLFSQSMHHNDELDSLLLDCFAECT